ncbi:MFS transporter [Shimia sagamensis]|uniref:MFS transporter, UMF1 family n=1 Tax=Shimia sagamensis TaxID=1566352 RepID=A0ABY1NEY2_9RHOB|nr:MFS transporter [Shimia sagamensis]SMP08047.1 MFS transporter, UMF1 family [Shimia sagamensis]
MSDVSARKRIWGWFFFDWASQPYHTLLVTFIFGPFFASVASEFFMNSGQSETAAKASAQTLWAWNMGLAGLVIGVGAPFLGALADTRGRKRPWIIGFSIMYVIGAAALWFTAPDGSNMYWMLLVFSIGFIGAEYALIFTNSQLPDLGTEEEIGKISGSGFAFGYFGGLLALILVLIFFAEQGGGVTIVGLAPGFGLLDPEAREGTRAVGPFTAIWFLVFMVPYFLWVHDPLVAKTRGTVSDALKTLKTSIANLKARRSLLNFLIGSMLYRDALNGIYAFGGIYAFNVLDWTVPQVGIFGIIGAASATLFCYIGGKVDSRIGPKPVVIFAIWVLILLCFVLVNMSRDALFGVPLVEGSKLPDIIMLAAGALIGGMGGILQASSRSLMVRHTDPAVPTESFGLYGLSGRATAFIAPILIGLATTITGSARLGVSPVILLFLLGLILLRWVNPQGDRETWGTAS